MNRTISLDCFEFSDENQIRDDFLVNDHPLLSSNKEILLLEFNIVYSIENMYYTPDSSKELSSK